MLEKAEINIVLILLLCFNDKATTKAYDKAMQSPKQHPKHSKAMTKATPL
jgi:hypothetical protein